MALAYLSLGSNIEPERNVSRCLKELMQAFPGLLASPVYRCPAEGFEGDDFYNLAVVIETDLDPQSLELRLKTIEHDLGRRRGSARFADRVIDIDLLMLDERVGDFGSLRLPRDEILRYPFVLKPLLDLLPEGTHPETGRALSAHWAEMSARGHALTEIELAAG
jgi:2-amino-4-hydroxy-6-hydroxymethyldihydropteridine diphosphokinase